MHSYEVTPDDVKEFLSRCREDADALNLLQERMEAVESKTGLHASTLTGMPGNPNVSTDRIGAAVAQLIPLQQAVHEAEIQVQERQARTLAIIDLLKQNRVKNWPQKTTALVMRYVDCCDWQTITFSLFGTLEKYPDNPDTYLRRAQGLHRAALCELAEFVTADKLVDDYV